MTVKPTPPQGAAKRYSEARDYSLTRLLPDGESHQIVR
jgi:hypothetical protein